MKVKITCELHNLAISGNTISKIITINDEDLEDMADAEKKAYIDGEAEDVVMGDMIGIGWEEITE